MREEIGSDFWEYNYKASKEINIKFKGLEKVENIKYFKSGRNAIKALCIYLDNLPKRVLLPLFTCETVIQPFVDEGWKIEFYDVCTDLSLDLEDMKEKVNNFQPSVLYLQEYFGFNTLKDFDNYLDIVKNSEIIIVNDITQTLNSTFIKIKADYYIASLRKFFAVPDGGMLASDKNLNEVRVCSSNPDITKLAFEAFDLKNKYFELRSEINDAKGLNVKKIEYRNKYKELNELIASNGVLTDVNKETLNIYSNVDIENLALKRRRNYNFLYENTREISGFKAVLQAAGDNITPLYFPIYIEEKRQLLQEHLIKNKIYCPIVWPKPEKLNVYGKKAEYIYNHILCIPIDQRYDECDMRKIVETLKLF